MSWCISDPYEVEHFVPDDDTGRSLCGGVTSFNWIENEPGKRRCKRCEKLSQARASLGPVTKADIIKLINDVGVADLEVAFAALDFGNTGTHVTIKLKDGRDVTLSQYVEYPVPRAEKPYAQIWGESGNGGPEVPFDKEP